MRREENKKGKATFLESVSKSTLNIGVGRFRILGGQGLEFFFLGGGGKRGGQIPSRHMTSKRRRCDVTTSHRRHVDVVCPLGF